MKANALRAIGAALTMVAASAIADAPAIAADLGTAPLESERIGSPDRWTLRLTPYGWLPFLRGDTTVKGRTAELDIKPYQVLENLEAMPWMSYAEARKGPLAFYNDIFYAKLGVSGGGVRARNFGPSAGGSLAVSASLDFEMAVVELGGAYEIARWVSGGGAGSAAGFVPFTAFDIIAGARYWHQDLSVSVALAGALNIGGLQIAGNRAIAGGGSVDWVDPLVGARFRHSFAPGHELIFRADIGGFDVGSKFSWNVLAAYSFDLMVRDGVKYSGVIGYRALDVNYAQGANQTRYGYDVLQHGPLSALTISF